MAGGPRLAAMEEGGTRPGLPAATHGVQTGLVWGSPLRGRSTWDQSHSDGKSLGDVPKNRLTAG